MIKSGRRPLGNELHSKISYLPPSLEASILLCLKNRFLLAKCIATGAFSFPTPFLICFFLAGVNAGQIAYLNRLLLILILLLAGALVGVAFYYKDSALTALKDWYPSEKTQ
jgi:hypothetical protein